MGLRETGGEHQYRRTGAASHIAVDERLVEGWRALSGDQGFAGHHSRKLVEMYCIDVGDFEFKSLSAPHNTVTTHFVPSKLQSEGNEG